MCNRWPNNRGPWYDRGIYPYLFTAAAKVLDLVLWVLHLVYRKRP